MCVNDRKPVRQAAQRMAQVAPRKPQDIAEILRGIEQLQAKVRGRNLQTLEYLLDMAMLEVAGLLQSEERRESDAC